MHSDFFFFLNKSPNSQVICVVSCFQNMEVMFGFLCNLYHQLFRIQEGRRKAKAA